ncbi:S9 family peptidase [Litchfieldella xinjiangensis]|uniref:S9 family peptidase n=1 Tax=Litchfieldella xinjiangensis TaxID=1166948 RepID=UPI0006941617|nr:prolyl oligopeptidase family serine peptidase [Halomonas xinjiangensis]
MSESTPDEAAEEAALAEAARPADGLADLRADETGAYWLAADAETGARRLWHWHGGQAHPLTPTTLDVSSRVNGYGGGAHARLGEHAYFVAGSDQTLYRVSTDSSASMPHLERWWNREASRYGGLLADPVRHRLLAVEETGSAREASQALVALDATGRRVIMAGSDFYGAPALSPDGQRLAWVEWQLPHMPWQRARLCIADLNDAGDVIGHTVWDPGAAVTQPRFRPDGQLVALSDHGGWWQPYRIEDGTAHRTGTSDADHAPTPWQLGECHHVWRRDGPGVLVRFVEGSATLWQVSGQGHDERRLLPDSTRIVGLAEADDWLYAITQGPAHAARLERIALAGPEFGSESPEVLQALPTAGDPPVPHTVTAAISPDEATSAFVYFPDTPDAGPAPLIVRVHGGPTAACYPVFDPLVRWWVRQGYVVADLNPRGSGNFGRAYRERLARGWGRLDVEDSVALADELTRRGIADPQRCYIRGQSAGGFTVLNALAGSDRFRAGASLYGVTDAQRLASQTHRFESGYLDWLLGDDDAKRRMSPIHRLSSFAGAVIFFQGERDSIVVPEQTHAMAEALRERGLTVEVVLFTHEGHGIRHPDNRRRMIASELAFFAVHASETTCTK